MKRRIIAADETVDTRLKDASDILKDDFNYVLDGLDTLSRRGLVVEGLDIADKLSVNLSECINEIAQLLGS